MKLDTFKFAVLAVCCALAVAAGADEAETFGKWRVSVGGAFNGNVRSDVGMRNVPMPKAYVVTPSGADSRATAEAKALSGKYDNGGFIASDQDSSKDGMTKNWQLPASSFYSDNPGANPSYLRGNGKFVLENSYYEEEVVKSSRTRSDHDSSDDEFMFGVSAEISRELWIHDEAFENRWGVDFAAGFSYFFSRDIYRSRGSVTQSDVVRTASGAYETTVDPEYALYEYYETPPARQTRMVDGVEMFGDGWNSVRGGSPLLNLNMVGAPVDTGSTSYRTERSSTSYEASGDYRELEMLFMLRPWYEITDWWRVYGEAGVGVSWGRFDSRFSGYGVSHSEDFEQWDCYGVAGLGTMFRYGMFDISFDVLGRFLRDDFDVDGTYVNGKIERSDWGFRVMAGIEF